MNPKELQQRLRSKNPPLVVDVRSGLEFRGGHIPGALHAPALKILLGMAALPANRECELVVTCEHGPRAALAGKLLGLRGYRDVTLLEGHMSSWRRERLPLEK